MPQQVGLPRKVSVAAGAEAGNRELPVDTDAPHLVDASASERFKPSDVVAPLLKRFPSHASHTPIEGVRASCDCATTADKKADDRSHPPTATELTPRSQPAVDNLGRPARCYGSDSHETPRPTCLRRGRSDSGMIAMDCGRRRLAEVVS